jgi:PAS domain S-box-containing protein
MAGSLSDVTERWILEEQLRRFFHLSSDLVCTAGFDGYFKTVNPAFSKTLGYTEQELLSRPFVEFTHPDDARKTSEEMAHLIAGGNTFSFENRYKNKNGKWIWLSWNSISIPEEKIIFGIARDITERKRSEEKLQHYASQLARSNRELQDFATIASHDLQEPLRKVQAFGDRLLTRCKGQLDEQAGEYLDRMLSAVTRMKTLINDLLNFSRVDTRGQPFRAVNLEDVAKDVISDLEVLIASTEGEVAVGELPVIDADATQMRQLLQNLIGNALKFRRPGTPPRVEIKAEVSSESSNGSQCNIIVEDNGIGFDEKYTDRIFTIFQRLHGKNEYE